MEGGGRNRKRREDRRWMRRTWRKLGRGQGRKGNGMRPKGRGWRTSNGCRRSLYRRTRARGKRVQAPEGRMGRKTGGEVRSGKNVIIKAGRREGRRRVRAPKRGKGRRMNQARGNRSVHDVITLDYWGSRVLNRKYRLLTVLEDRHLVCVRRCRFRREQRLTVSIYRKG